MKMYFNFISIFCFDHLYHWQIDGITGVEISGHDFISKSIHLAKSIQNTFGIRVGDAISVCSENRIEFAITNLATFIIGATIAPLNHSYSESMFAHFVWKNRYQIQTINF